MSGRTRKAITKRLKLTKRGKMMHRHPGQDHFLAKRSGAFKRRLHGHSRLSEREKKAVEKQLYY